MGISARGSVGDFTTEGTEGIHHRGAEGTEVFRRRGTATGRFSSSLGRGKADGRAGFVLWLNCVSLSDYSDSDWKSISVIDGKRYENIVLPFLFVTAKSPRLMISMPINTSIPVNSVCATLGIGKAIPFGSTRPTWYIGTSSVPCACAIGMKPSCVMPSVSTTLLPITLCVAPVSQSAENSCSLSIESGFDADSMKENKSEIEHGLIS